MLELLVSIFVLVGGYKFQTDHDACVHKKEGQVKIDEHELCSTYKKIYEWKAKLEK